VERVWTTPGVHPYDEVTWERRDVLMTNWRDGSIVFEQRGVEFPDFWSVNAANIVTTKYFRGALGTPQREGSLRQLIDRVVTTYRTSGVEHGYFASDDDAEVFGLELTWMLLHQVFSFNSPVWFNVGTPSPQQVSACFILSVDDSMESILDWYKEEGLIFKGGSGAGGAPAPSSRAGPPGGQRRWSSSTWTTPTSRSSSASRLARKRRSACCVTRASTWTSAART
jgi:ribonucleoside-diphosphate reductase alpha chain